MKILALLAVALLLTGCATTIQAEPWWTDYVECSRENRMFVHIPDFGITFERHRDKCLRQRAWVKTGAYKWTRAGAATGSPANLQPVPCHDLNGVPGMLGPQRDGICRVEQPTSPAPLPPLPAPTWDTGL